MTVQCVHCKQTWRGKPGMHGGRSKVVETRIVTARTSVTTMDKNRTLSKRRKVVRTVRRVRQCLTCRFRWRTIEVTSR